MAGYVVRFSEYQYYNINHDEDWVRFMGTTSQGSYFCEEPMYSSQILRDHRNKFKERVLEAIATSLPPRELDLG